MYNESLQGKSNHPQHRQKTTIKNIFGVQILLNCFYEISFSKTKKGCQRLYLFLTNKLSDLITSFNTGADHAKFSLNSNDLFDKHHLKDWKHLKELWHCIMFSFYHKKNKQTEDRFIVIRRKSTSLHVHCLYVWCDLD